MSSPLNFKIMVSSKLLLFIRHNKEFFLTLLVYVDDVLITDASKAAIIKVERVLHKQFTIKDVGYANTFLAIKLFVPQLVLILANLNIH